MNDITVTVIPPAPMTVEITPPAPIELTLQQGAPGLKGDKGDQGEQGIQGPLGLAGQTYIFNQLTPLSVWTISHNMGNHPSVSVVDSSGNVVIGDIEYIDSNNITITFGSAFGGIAYLN